MKKFLAVMLVALSGVALADAPKVANNIEGAAESIAPAFTTPPKDVGNIPITFPHQPPLVPHSIRGLQVTKNANQCLGCHSPDVAPTTGAPRVPESHFLDRDGKRTEGTSPRRYFCLQCHVQQANVNPIIQNKFDTIPQAQSK